MTGRVLFFGSYDAGLHPRVAVLRDGLAAHGWSVEELNVPLGASTADKVAAAGSARAAGVLAGRQLRAWRGLVAGRSAVRPDPDVVVVGYLGHGDIHLARALFRHSTLVLDHLVGLADTVTDRQVGGSATTRALGLADSAALRAADLVVVDTPEQAAALAPAYQRKAVVAPVGAGAQWFRAADSAAGESAAGESAAGDSAAGDATADGPRPLRVVFFGLFTPLQGTTTIARAIADRPELPIEVTLVGTGQDHAQVLGILGDDPRVTWVDWVDSESLPGLVADHDVCLGVFGTGDKTRRVVPTKVYQGMAAGTAVVTGDTPAVRALGDGVIRVPCGEPEALADLLAALAGDPDRLAAARARARSVAERFTPLAVTEALDTRIRAGAPARRLPPLTINAWLRWDVIDEALARIDAADVLEIGPGEGAVAARLARGRNYTGVELSARTRELTRRRLIAGGTPGRLVGSLDELGADEKFDLVCAFEVIEHIEDDQAALEQWCARLRPGATLLLSTPADPDRMAAHDVIAGHFRRYDPEQLAELARRCGCVDVRVVGVGYPFGLALEEVRNRVAERRLAAEDGAADTEEQIATRTEASSSLMQPPMWSGLATRSISAPGRWLQRRWPDRGTGLVLVARAPR